MAQTLCDCRRELEQHPFLNGLEPEWYDLLTGCTQLVGYGAGHYLGRTGEPAETFYLIISGHVNVEIDTPNRQPVLIQTLGRGDVVGWSWLTPPHRWRFTAQAVEPVRALEIQGTALRFVCEENPELGYELMKRLVHVIAGRLTATRHQLLNRMR